MTLVWGLSTLTMALVLLGLAVVGSSLYSQAQTGRFASVLVALPFGAATCFYAWISWRIVHARVVITPDHVLVAGPVRTRRVPLDEAEGFAAGIRGNQPTITLSWRGHRSLGIWIFNRNGFMWQFKQLAQKLEPRAQELSEALADAKSGASGTVSSSPSG
jgi:hypothetical protein